MTTCATCKRESGIEYAFCSNCGSQLRKISKPLSHNSSQDSCVKKGFATYGVLPHSIAVTKHKHTGGFLLKPPPRRIESAIPLVKLRTSNFSDNKDNNSRDGGDSSTISQVTSLNSKETIQKRMNSNPIRDSFLPGIMMAIDQHFLRENESSKVILQREKFMEQQITLAHTYRLQNSASIDRADNEALKFDREDSTSRSNSPASLSNRREISTSRSTSPAKTVRPRPGTVGQDSRDIGDVSHYMNDVGSVGTLYKQYIKRERILSGLTVASLDTLSIPLSASGGYEISDLFNSLDQKRDLYDLCGPHISSKKDNNNSSIVENTKVNTAVNLKLNRDDHDDDDKRHIGEDLPREAEVRPYSPSSAAALPWFCGIEENKEENKEDIDNENNEINKIFAINPEEKVDICGDIEVKPEVREESKKEVEKTEKDSHLERYRSRKESSESYHSYSVIARLFKTSCTAIDHALIQSEVSFTIDYSPKDLFDRQMIIKGALLAGGNDLIEAREEFELFQLHCNKRKVEAGRLVAEVLQLAAMQLAAQTHIDRHRRGSKTISSKALGSREELHLLEQREAQILIQIREEQCTTVRTIKKWVPIHMKGMKKLHIAQHRLQSLLRDRAANLIQNSVRDAFRRKSLEGNIPKLY